MNLISELKRRNVFRVAIAYVIAAWLLLQVIDVVVPLLNLPDWVGRFLLLLLAVGFPLALIFAWAFELTPEGLKRESEVDRSQSITTQTGRKLDYAIIFVLVVALGWFAWDKFLNRQPAPAQQPTASTTAPATSAPAAIPAPGPEKSVAVLPFLALSSGQDDGYFADGLTEEILNALAQLPELLVTARTSSFSFKGQDLPVQEIAKQLGVRNIVEGSVRRAGDRLRVTAQLVRAVDGFHLWSENYDSTSADTIQVQQDIAEKIALALNVVMDDEKREAMRQAGLRDVEAFIAMQKAREKYEEGHGDADQIASLREANKYYEQVLQRVPGYPPALEEHSDLYVHMLFNSAAGTPMNNVSEEDIAQAPQQMLHDVSQAVENARNFSEQNEYEIDLSFLGGDWRGNLARIQRYVDETGCNKPSWAPQFALPFGDAAAYAKRVHEVTTCDPLSSSNWFDESRAWLWAGDAEQALAVARKGMEVAPGGWLPFALNWALTATGQFEELTHAIETHLAFETDRLSWRVNRLAAMGQVAEIAPMLAELDALPDYDDFLRLQVTPHIGDREAANAAAAGMDQRPQGAQALLLMVYWCACGAPWDLEATPNFAARIKEAGLAWPPPSPIKWPLKTW